MTVRPGTSSSFTRVKAGPADTAVMSADRTTTTMKENSNDRLPPLAAHSHRTRMNVEALDRGFFHVSWIEPRKKNARRIMAKNVLGVWCLWDENSNYVNPNSSMGKKVIMAVSLGEIGREAE